MLWMQTRVTTSLDAISTRVCVCVCVATWLLFLGSRVTALWPAATVHQRDSANTGQALAAAPAWLLSLLRSCSGFPTLLQFPACV